MTEQQLPAKKASSPLQRYGDFLKEPKRQEIFEKLLPKGLGLERFMVTLMNSARKNPKICECSPESVFMAAKSSAELGLEPDTGLGHGYLVPYGQELTFVPGYKGWLLKLYQCAGIMVKPVVVYAGEHFVVVEGTDPRIEHIPDLNVPRSDENIIAVYATSQSSVGTMKQFVVLSKEEVDKVRAASKSGRSEYSPWARWYAEMAKKTAIKRLVKMLPLSNEVLARLMEVEAEDSIEPRIIDQKPGAVRKSLNLRTEEPEELPAPPADMPPPEPREPGMDG